MSVDKQQTKMKKYIKHLQNIKNKIIINKLMKAKDTVNKFLYIRIKTI